MAGDDKKTTGIVFLLLGIVWLLGKLNIGLSADVIGWLLTVIALLGGLYMLFM